MRRRPNFSLSRRNEEYAAAYLASIQIALVFETADYQFDQGLAIFGFGLHPRTQQAFSSATERMRRASAPTAYS